MQRRGQGLPAESGATAVEYTIMASLVAAILVLSVVLLGQRTRSNFCDTDAALENGGVTSQVSESHDCT